MSKSRNASKSGGARSHHELTQGEWVIMKAVWENEPVPAPTVQELLLDETAWAYSTVKTMMDRMVKKGLLTTERIRNLILYRSAISRSQAQKGELMRTLKRAFDGALTPMMQFLLNSSDLSGKQLDELERVIKRNRCRAASRRKLKTDR